MEIKIGDFALIKGHFTLDLRKVTRLTNHYVYGIDAGSSWQREWRSNRSQVLFCGPADAATLLRERLRSSDALATQEHRAVKVRQQKRDEKYIAEAIAALANGGQS